MKALLEVKMKISSSKLQAISNFWTPVGNSNRSFASIDGEKCRVFKVQNSCFGLKSTQRLDRILNRALKLTTD